MQSGATADDLLGLPLAMPSVQHRREAIPQTRRARKVQAQQQRWYAQLGRLPLNYGLWDCGCCRAGCCRCMRRGHGTGLVFWGRHPRTPPMRGGLYVLNWHGWATRPCRGRMRLRALGCAECRGHLWLRRTALSAMHRCAWLPRGRHDLRGLLQRCRRQRWCGRRGVAGGWPRPHWAGARQGSSCCILLWRSAAGAAGYDGAAGALGMATGWVAGAAVGCMSIASAGGLPAAW